MNFIALEYLRRPFGLWFGLGHFKQTCESAASKKLEGAEGEEWGKLFANKDKVCMTLIEKLTNNVRKRILLVLPYRARSCAINTPADNQVRRLTLVLLYVSVQTSFEVPGKAD